MPKNPIEELDSLISHQEWAKARELLVSLRPLQAVHTVLAAMHWTDCLANLEEWELFQKHLSGRYPSLVSNAQGQT